VVKDLLKPIALFALLALMANSAFFQYNYMTLSQSPADSKTSTWISRQNNLNVTIELDPHVPVIDQKTKLAFEIRNLNSSIPGSIDNLNARVTVTDHDGRLFKFDSQPVSNGKFSVDYIFPDDWQHRIILQLYKNTTAFALGSFDVVIPHPQQASPPLTDFFSTLLKNLF
jgi:hypothetical protein